MPTVWWVSRLCDEFACLPSQAIREWREAPEGLIEDILEARAVAATWRTWTSAERKTELPASPLMDLVAGIDMGLDADALQARTEGGTHG